LEESSVDEKSIVTIRRRDLLRAAASVGVAAAAIGASPGPADNRKSDDRGKRKSQYQPNSAEVRAFYRVNSYPKK
jgi:hypothetical protein